MFVCEFHTQEERENHQRRFLEHNPEVRDTAIHLKLKKTKSNGGSHEEVRGKPVGLGPSCTTCEGYDAQMVLPHTKNLT